MAVVPFFPGNLQWGSTASSLCQPKSRFRIFSAPLQLSFTVLDPQLLKENNIAFCLLLHLPPPRESNLITSRTGNVPWQHGNMNTGHILPSVSLLQLLHDIFWRQKLLNYCNTSAQLIVNPYSKCSYRQTARPYQRRFHMGLSCSSVNVFTGDLSDGRGRLHCVTLLLKPSWERWENTATSEQLCWKWPTNWTEKRSITPPWKVHLSSTLAPMFSPSTLLQFHPLSLTSTVLFGVSQRRSDVNPQKRSEV